VDFSEAIIDATSDIFSTMIMLEAIPGSPLTEKMLSFHESISGILGFSGDIKGMLRIHCPDRVAMAITGSLLGMEVNQIDDDVNDAIGEIANMVAGGLKVNLAKDNKNIDLSIPTAIGGKAYTVHSMASAERITVPFALETGQMLVELEFIRAK